MLRHGPETISDVIPVQPECLAAGIDASERNVDVGMFRVEMHHGHPFEGFVQVGLHATHHVASKSLQVETLAEFGGDDQLPQPWIGALLPFKKFRRDLDASGCRGEPRPLGLERSVLPRNIFAVRPPMPVTRLLEYVTRTEQC